MAETTNAKGGTASREHFERVMALADDGAFPRATALDLLAELDADQLEDLLPSQERLHTAIVRARRSARDLMDLTLRLRMSALELVWLAPAYAR